MVTTGIAAGFNFAWTWLWSFLLVVFVWIFEGVFEIEVDRPAVEVVFGVDCDEALPKWLYYCYMGDNGVIEMGKEEREESEGK